LYWGWLKHPWKAAANWRKVASEHIIGMGIAHFRGGRLLRQPSLTTGALCFYYSLGKVQR
jgi:hypothetical protein